jgi:hypothetical protein
MTVSPRLALAPALCPTSPFFVREVTHHDIRWSFNVDPKLLRR